MANRRYRNERDRFGREDEYSRQAEQFEAPGYDWHAGERGQMGEGAWREDEREFETSRRDPEYGRDYRRGSDFSAGEPSAYPTGRFGPNPYAPRQRVGFASFTGSNQGGRDFTAPRYTGDRSYSSAYGGYGAGARISRPVGWREGAYRSGYDDERGWWERAGDEVASWFGNEEAARRREMDHRGKGPMGYTRSDERIREDANDRLTEDWRVDARNIEVGVSGGELTLDGTVTSRNQKRCAEDCVEDILGVTHVQNNLRVQETTA
jgi:osmotically-inducible protein OsmY